MVPNPNKWKLFCISGNDTVVSLLKVFIESKVNLKFLKEERCLNILEFLNEGVLSKFYEYKIPIYYIEFTQDSINILTSLKCETDVIGRYLSKNLDITYEYITVDRTGDCLNARYIKGFKEVDKNNLIIQECSLLGHDSNSHRGRSMFFIFNHMRRMSLSLNYDQKSYRVREKKVKTIYDEIYEYGVSDWSYNV